jgi:glucokinase
MIVLAGDVGGTNARIALVEMNGQARVVKESRYRSHDYPGLSPIVRRFCEESGSRPDRACIAMACPLVDDECTAPNLPWKVNARRLASEIEIPRTALINDFVAVGFGIPFLTASDLATLQPGELAPSGTIALIGAGTGLGQGFLIWEGDRYRVLPSEGGHADFAPRGALEAGLLGFLESQFHRVSWERLLSGAGLVNIYRYLVSSGVAPEQNAIKDEMQREDPAAVITRHGLARSDAICDRTLDLFCGILGAQAGNLALTVVAKGGVYLAGGIVPRIVERLRSGAFMKTFLDKGRLSDLLAEIPVHVILNPSVGLLGAAATASRLD